MERGVLHLLNILDRSAHYSESVERTKENTMRYSTKALLAGLLVIGLCGAAQAAPAGFTTQKGDGISVDVPTDWKMMPKDFMAKLQERAPSGTLLMGAQGPDGGMPQMMVIAEKDPQATPGKIDAMPDSEVKTWCDTINSNLKAKTGKDIPVKCAKVKTASGQALLMQMVVPAGEGEMVSKTWTVAGKDKSVTMTVMYAKTLESKVGAQVNKMAESIKLGK